MPMVTIRFQGPQPNIVPIAACGAQCLAGRFPGACENVALILTLVSPEGIGDLVGCPPGFSHWQGLVHTVRISAMERVRTVSLKGLSRRQASIVSEGQREAARVWTACRDRHRKARQERTPWPTRDEYHKATPGGRFAPHSQSIQQVFRAFDAAVDSAGKNRRNGGQEIRYPYKDKRFYPLMWSAQAMHREARRMVLPMGRGRPSLVFPRPVWLSRKCACQMVWNGVHNELPISLEEPDSHTPDWGTTEKHATVDLGQIHQAAVVTNTGEALVVSGRGIRSLKHQQSKQLGEIASQRSRCQKGSRRWRKLGRTRAKRTLRCKRQVRGLRHKGTRQVGDFCKGRGIEALFVGDGVPPLRPPLQPAPEPAGVRPRTSMTCNRSPNKTASCLVGRMTHASPGMSVVHPAGMATRRGGMATRRGGVLYTATVTSPKGGTRGARPVALKAAGMSSAGSTCTRRRLVKWCRFRSASRITVQDLCGLGGVVAWT